MMRANGVLLGVSSLPGKYGIGCFSLEAYKFIDQLKAAGQKCWQILPLGPTGYGDSPYQSFSTFAGNPYFINLEQLVSYGWLTKEDLAIAEVEDERNVDYGKLYNTRYVLLRKAYNASKIGMNSDFIRFCQEEKEWLCDYALYMALKTENEQSAWDCWDEKLRYRDPESLNQKRAALSSEIEFYKFLQYEFRKQWKDLHAYANAQGIQIIGDIPIYVSFDSADAWANKELFQFDEEGKPKAVAGVPADGFSADGQVWGNPLYDWDYHEKTGYEWWIKRLRFCFSMYDIVRIDHFRGFDEYFSVPFGDKHARNGHWEQGPGIKLFNKVEEAFPGKEIIAEDLGYVTDTVRQLVKDTGYPGMKVLEFAFDSRDSGSASDYLTFNYDKNSVVYTGTHDNETVIGWFTSGLQKEEQIMVREYFNDFHTPDDQMHMPMICGAMRSVADLCVIPMQDILGLGNEARMNAPSTSGANWKWRLLPGEFSEEKIETLNRLTKRFGR
ncbi:MAG: 4-alpha-glucanotransferase [Lachnospiraceae bacterium]|nr:4-alpha-glucanotransferase [Lachnospiraceae bacterium]